MSSLRLILAELVGLFIDDSGLALAAALLIAVVAGLAWLNVLPSQLAGLVLALGSAAILLESVFRSARR